MTDESNGENNEGHAHKSIGFIIDDGDVTKIAEAVSKRVMEGQFYISAQDHYNQHRDLKELLDAINHGKSKLASVFWSLIGLGVMALAILGLKSWHE